MNANNCGRIVLGLVLACSPFSHARAAGNANDCRKQEIVVGKDPWFAHLPDRSKLPDLDAVRAVGGLILLDDTIVDRMGCGYTFIAEAGNAESQEAFSTFTVHAPYNTIARINARVQQPDGTVQEVSLDQVQCSLTQYESGKYYLLNALLPKEYVVIMPHVTAGSVVQLQVMESCNRYQATYDLWSTSDQRFGPAAAAARTTNYPAAMIRLTIWLNRDETYKPVFYPDDHLLSWKNLPPREDDPVHFPGLRVSLERPAGVYEPYSPERTLVSPKLTLLDVTEKAERRGDWERVIKAVRRQFYDAIHPDENALHWLDEKSPPSAGADAANLALHYHRYVRDHFRTGEYYRLGAFELPNHYVINLLKDERRVGGYMRFNMFAALLKAKGVPFEIVLMRSRTSPPIPRETASMYWFDDYLLRVQGPAGPLYLDPVIEGPSGLLPVRFQGGEGLALDEKQWRWITLPVTTPADNSSRFSLTFHEMAGLEPAGEARLESTGFMADNRFESLRSLNDSQREERATRWLDQQVNTGLNFSSVQVNIPADRDQPLVITARFAAKGLLQRLGVKRTLHLTLSGDGPSQSVFAADKRHNDIDFGTPARRITEVRLPATEMQHAEPPEIISISFEGLHYERKAVIENGMLVILRTFDTSGTLPASRYGELKQFLSRVNEADNLSVILRAEQ